MNNLHFAGSGARRVRWTYAIRELRARHFDPWRRISSIEPPTPAPFALHNRTADNKSRL